MPVKPGPSTDPVDDPKVAETPTALFKPGGPKQTFTALKCPNCGNTQPSKQTNVQKLEWTCGSCGRSYYTMLRIDASGYLLAEGS